MLVLHLHRPMAGERILQTTTNQRHDLIVIAGPTLKLSAFVAGRIVIGMGVSPSALRVEHQFVIAEAQAGPARERPDELHVGFSNFVLIAFATQILEDPVPILEISPGKFTFDAQDKHTNLVVEAESSAAHETIRLEVESRL